MSKKFKVVFHNATLKWIMRYQGSTFSRIFNFLRNTLEFVPELEWDNSNGLYRVSDNSESLYIARKSRIPYYKSGIRDRLDFLVNEYLCNSINFSDGDVIIDVGANIGEFSLGLCKRKNLKILAFEPEPKEHSALQINLSGLNSEIYCHPLWSATCEMKFYPSNETGDSSLIRQNEAIQSVRVKCFSLDEILSRSSIVGKKEKIKLLKLEAEGAEPEILNGMKQNISRVEYVSADVGPERGIKKESTLILVQSILIQAGFEPVKFGMPRAVMLFKNTRIDDI